MTQEDKQLLLKDLCARLPYGVKINIEYYDLQGDGELKNRNIELGTGNIGYCFGNSHWLDFKPYLRPMSSMTEEEENEYRAINCYEGLFPRNEDALDYALEHHLDFRDLIPMGLALEAPKDMYKTE